MFEDTLNMFVFTIQSSQPRTQVVLGLLHISSKKHIWILMLLLKPSKKNKNKSQKYNYKQKYNYIHYKEL
jgi:hypothetical protein